MLPQIVLVEMRERARAGDLSGSARLGEPAQIFDAIDVCVEPVLNLEEAAQHPQTEARKMVVEVPKPKGGVQKQIGFPVKFSKSQPRYDHIGCDVGDHTDDVLNGLGYSEAEIAILREAGVFGPQEEA